MTPSVSLTATPGSGTQLNYTTSVSPSTGSVTVTPIAADPGASITVNGQAVTSGSVSPSITLNASGTTTVRVHITAQDSITTRDYVVVVSKSSASHTNL